MYERILSQITEKFDQAIEETLVETAKQVVGRSVLLKSGAIVTVHSVYISEKTQELFAKTFAGNYFSFDEIEFLKQLA